MEEALTAWLLGSTELSGLVSNRLTWATRPQASALPAGVLQKISGAPLYADEGQVGLFTARIQVDWWGGTYAETVAAARAGAARLSGPSGRFTSGNFDFRISFVENEFDSFERGLAGADLYRRSQDFIILYKEI